MPRLQYLTALLVTAFSLSSVRAHAVPTLNVLFRDPQTGLTLYADSNDANHFWFTPVLVPVLNSKGKTRISRKVSKGQVEYSVYVTPQLPKDLAVLLPQEVPGLTRLSQLLPVRAKKIGMQIPEFTELSLTTVASDIDYLDQPQLMRFSLSKKEAQDFDDLYASSPGVPIQWVISYDAQIRKKFLDIQLSCQDVAKALKIGVTGQYAFLGGDIVNQVEHYLVTRSLTISSMGDWDLSTWMATLVGQCFDPSNEKTSSDVGSHMPDSVTHSVTFGASGPIKTRAQWERRLRQVAVAPLSSGSFQGVQLKSNLQTSGVDPKAIFEFKRNQVTNDKVIVFRHEQFQDAEETAVRSAYLTAYPKRTAARRVVPLSRTQVRVEDSANEQNVLHTGLNVGTHQQWVLSATFTYSAESKYSNGQRRAYRWDAAWNAASGSPDQDLYFRIGDGGNWQKVLGRAVIGSDSLEQGEIQIKMDKDSLWKKIPAKLRNSRGLGLIPPVFEYDTFYPEYLVTITGRQIE